MQPGDVLIGKLKEFLIPMSPELSLFLAKEFKRRLIENIRTNKYGFSLSQATLRARIFRGVKDSRPLIETGEYLAAIIRRETVVGVKEGTHKGNRNQKKNLSYEELSHILEYGRKDLGIPAFSVWRKTLEEMEGELDELTAKFISTYKMS